jgi:hypothetical protein
MLHHLGYVITYLIEHLEQRLVHRVSLIHQNQTRAFTHAAVCGVEIESGFGLKLGD